MNVIEKLLTPYKTKGTRIRIGPESDSGYVCIKEIANNAKNLISFGVGGNIEFEKIFVDNNVKVTCYDAEPNYDVFPQLKDLDTGSSTLIDGMTYVKEFATPDNINKLFPEENFILKMDIENSEWDVLRAITSKNMEKIDMLIIEFHINNEFYRTRNFYAIADVLIKLNEFHSLVHVHGNNHEGYVYGQKIPNVLECCYISKKLNLSTEDKEDMIFPIKNLDFPCKPNEQDLVLNWWN